MSEIYVLDFYKTDTVSSYISIELFSLNVLYVVGEQSSSFQSTSIFSTKVDL